MHGEDFRFGGGASHTMLNPLVGLVVLIACILICVLPRRYAIAPFLAVAFLAPMDQVVVVGGFHFYMLRVLILFGWIRMLTAKMSSRYEIFSGGVNAVDKALIFCTLISAVDFLLLWRDSGALTNQLGTIYTVLGSYVLLRFLIQDEEDLVRTIRVFAYVAAVIAVIMVCEQATGRNLYSLLGSHEAATLMERDGRFRAMGPFAHPILAGTFGAILVPLFVGLWWKSRRNRFAALVGIVASSTIIIASVSSTPALAYAAGLGALCLWPLRRQMRLIRWGIVVSLIALQMAMKAPVWALIARVDVIGGSSGYHRYMLVDQFIRRFGDWWLLGTKFNGQWGWDMWDLANQYVAVGEVSGLLPFIFFLAIIVFGFKYVGMARKASEGNKRQELFFWALGGALFANVVAFFGISYFDQTQVAWYALLAMISVAVTVPFREKTAESRLRIAVESTSPSMAYRSSVTPESLEDSALSTRVRHFTSTIP